MKQSEILAKYAEMLGLSSWIRTAGEFTVSYQSSQPLLGYKNCGI